MTDKRTGKKKKKVKPVEIASEDFVQRIATTLPKKTNTPAKK